MDFALLGPIEIRDGGRSVALGRGKPVALLIALLLEGDRVVTSDRLADALWGERPPATATKALHVHVRTLRRALGSDRIVTRPRGYSLRVGPDEVDIGRFEALAERGRSALTGGDSSAAARLLREALGLWRGAALADVADEPFARAEATRLEDLRLAVLEDRLEADLGLGRHVEVASELERLVSEHPLRERLHGQLMLALYRAGRQADALAAYRRARSVLVDELGLEPGPALRAVERQILAQDPALEAPAPAVSMPAGPELKLATVVVAELAPARSGGDPERLAARLERGRRAAADALRAMGGRLELGIGGTLLAAFGVPAAQEDHVGRALEAALMARAAVVAECGSAVAVRIGVESGEVVAGEGAVSGPAVSAAAALAGAAAAGVVAVGGRARTRSRGTFVFEDDRLLGAVGVGSRRGVRGLGTAFVGRADELALLEATWDRVARSSQPHMATVVGDAGIGKTSLLVTLRQRLGPGVRWYVGRCLAHWRGMSYGALAEIVRERFGLYRAETPDALVERLGSRRALAPLIGLEAEPGVHPWEARERLKAAWVDLLDEVASEGPAVAWVEGLHWADEPLLELLEHGLREATGPLLLLATARPELLARRPGWGAASAEASRLRLEPLDAEDAAMMLHRLAPGLPAEVADRVLDRAEGNPFFVEEVLAALLERGALRRESAGWSANGVTDALAVSDSVQGVIAARIDMLPAGAKRALQTASVVGRSFREGAVRALAATEPGVLAELCERDFVRRSRASAVPGEREFAFKHALTREVAYASIPVASRARLHAGFAAWLEQTGGGRDEDAPLLAHHYAESVAPAHADLAWGDEPDEARRTAAKAVRWLRRAAELATSRYAIADAVTLLAGARELERDPARRAELWYATATAHRVNYDIDAFRGAIEHAVALAPDAPVAARAYADLAYAGSQPYLWRHPPESRVVAGWIDATLERAGADDVARAIALVSRSQLDLERGNADADEALRLAERVGDPTVRSQAIHAQMHVAATQGRLQDACAWAQQGIEAAPGDPDREQRSGTLLYATFAHLRVGRIGDARRIADEHDALATPLSAHHRVHAVAAHLFVHMAAGDWPVPNGLAERAEAASAANADTPCQFNWRSLLMLALSHAIAGDADKSRRLEQAAEAALTVGGPLPREPALLRLAMVRGDRGAVEAVLSADPGSDIWDVDYLAARLDALALLGDRAGVEAEAERAFELGGYVEPFALRALGAVSGRRELLADAAERFAALGMERRARETRAMA